VVTVDLPDAEVEPGKIDLSHGFGLGPLNALLERGVWETPAILREQGDDIDKVLSPYLVARGLRLIPTNKDQGYDLIALGIGRLEFDGRQCADNSAPQYVAQIIQVLANTQ